MTSTHTKITTMLSTTLHQHIVSQLSLADHSYDDFLQIVTQYCVINRGRPNEEPLRMDSYVADGVTVYRLDINACHLITSGYGNKAGRLFGAIHHLFNGVTSAEYVEWVAMHTAERTLSKERSDNIWDTKEHNYFTHPVTAVRHPAVSSRDITDMINRLAGWDGKGKPAEHNRKHPANDVKAIEDKTVMRNIRKYISTMFPNLCTKAGVEGGTYLYRPLSPAVHQPLGYFDIGVAMYTSSINQQQSMLVMTPDLAEVVCSIFNPRVVLQMQQELLRLRALIANTNLPAMSPLTLTELNGTDAPATVTDASPMLEKRMAHYSIQQAIDTFGDKGYDEDKLDATREGHEEYNTFTTEHNITVSTYSTNVWRCAYKLHTLGWRLPEYALTPDIIT